VPTSAIDDAAVAGVCDRGLAVIAWRSRPAAAADAPNLRAAAAREIGGRTPGRLVGVWRGA